MQDHKPEDLTAIRSDLRAIFVSLELGRSTWLVTSLSTGSGEKISKHSVPGGEVSGLLTLFGRLKEREPASGRPRIFRSSPSKKRALTAFGFIAHRSRRVSRATLLTRPQL